MLSQYSWTKHPSEEELGTLHFNCEIKHSLAFASETSSNVDHLPPSEGQIWNFYSVYLKFNRALRSWVAFQTVRHKKENFHSNKMPFGERWELSSGSSVSSCWAYNETSIHKDIATLQLLHKVHSEKQSRPVRDVWHFALWLKTSLVHVCVRRPSVLLLTAAPVIPWSHDTPSQITVARQHPPTPLLPSRRPPTHPFSLRRLLPPFWCIQRWCRGRRGYLKRATFIFRSRGNDGNLRAILRLNPTSSLQPLPALHLSLPQFFRRSLFLSAHWCGEEEVEIRWQGLRVRRIGASPSAR